MSGAVVMAVLLSLQPGGRVPGLAAPADSLNMSQMGKWTQIGVVSDVAVDASRALLFAAYPYAVAVYDLSQPGAPTPVYTLMRDVPMDALAYRESDRVLVILASGVLETWDLSDPAAPQPLGSVPVSGRDDVVLTGNLAVVLGSGGLEVVDLSDPLAPAVGGVLSGQFLAMDAAGNYVYVATDPVGGPASVEVVDVSVLQNPTVVYSVPLSPADFYAVDVRISGSSLVLSGQNDAYGLRILDLSTPGTPTVVGQYTVSGRSYTFLVPYGNGVLAGYHTSQGDVGVEAVDLTTPASPSGVGDLGFSSMGIPMLRGFAGVGYTNGSSFWFYGVYGNPYEDGWIQIVDATVPGAMVDAGILARRYLLNFSYVEAQGNRAYVGGYFGGSVLALDLSDPAQPLPLGVLRGGMFPGIAADPSGWVFLGGYTDPYDPATAGIHAVDFSNPATPQIVGSVFMNAVPYNGMALVGDRLYAGFSDTIGVFNIANPSQPSLVGRVEKLNLRQILPWRGDTLIVSTYDFNAGTATLEILDLQTPSSPVVLHTLALGSGVVPPVMVLAGDTLLVRYRQVPDALYDLLAWDVSDPQNPVSLNVVFGSPPSDAWGLAYRTVDVVRVGSRRFLVAGGGRSDTTAVALLDITDLLQVEEVGRYVWNSTYGVSRVRGRVDAQGQIRIEVYHWGVTVLGVDATPVAEEGGTVKRVRLLPSVVRGALRFPAGMTGRLVIMDPSGRRVRRVALERGEPVVLPAGTYLWRLERGEEVVTGRVVVTP